jgi:hypothetical protein
MWGVRKGLRGGGPALWAGGPKFTRDCQILFFTPPAYTFVKGSFPGRHQHKTARHSGGGHT